MPDGRPKVLMTVEQLRRAVPGGIGAYARGLLGGLTALAAEGDGVDITLFTSRGPGQGLGRKGAASDPLSAFGLPLLLSRLPGPAMTRSWDHGISGVPGGFDIVHSVSLASPSRVHGRTVITVHDLAWRRYPEATTSRGRRWHEAALRRARESDAHLVVTSGFVAADLISDGIDAARLTIVHGGSDHLVAPDPSGTERVLRTIGVEGEFLLTVGTVEPRKNLRRLLAAYEQARPALPEPWPLVMVGPKGWGPALTHTADHQGVKFAGAVADDVLAGLYQRARAFVYVPLTEGYGLPPLEAMRHGTPSLVARGVPSVQDRGQLGDPPALLVDPLSVGDIAAGLTTVLTNETVRADLRARGRSHAVGRSWRDVARSHLVMWRSLA